MMTENEILELLSDYLDGELDKPTRQQVEEGLRRYPSARKTLEQLSRTVNLLGALPRTPAPANLAAAIADKARRQVVLTHSGRRLLAHQARLVLWRRMGAAAAVLAVGCLAAFAVWRAQTEIGMRSSVEVPVARGPEGDAGVDGKSNAARPSPFEYSDDESELGADRLRLQAALRPSEPVVDGEGDSADDDKPVGGRPGSGRPGPGRPGYLENARRDRDGAAFGNGGRGAGEPGLGGAGGARAWSTGGSDKNDKKNDARTLLNEKQYANGLRNASSLPSGAVMVKGDPAKVYALLKEALLQLETRGDARWSGSLDQLAQGHLPSVTITSDDPLVIEFVLGLLPKSPDVTGIEYASTAPTREEFARYEMFRKARKAAAVEGESGTEGGKDGGKEVGKEGGKDGEPLALAQAKGQAVGEAPKPAPGAGVKTDPSPVAPPPGDKPRPNEPARKPTDVKAKVHEAKNLEAKAPEVYVLDPEGRQRRYLANKDDKLADEGKGPAGPEKDADDSVGTRNEQNRGAKDAPKNDANPTATAAGSPNAEKKEVGDHRKNEQAESTQKSAKADPKQADPKSSVQPKGAEAKVAQPKVAEPGLGEPKAGEDPKAAAEDPTVAGTKREKGEAESGKSDAPADAKAKEAKEAKAIAANRERHDLRVRTDEVRKLLQDLQLPVQPAAPEQPAKTGAAAPAGKAPDRDKAATGRRTITLVLTLQPDQ